MLPNFVGIGAQRAGTTWVHRCLQEHPQAFVAEIKECHFFDSFFDKGQDWYEEHFAAAELGDYKAVGEITPNYLDVPEAAQRLADVVPDAKLFVILRDPVWRAYSGYKLFQDMHYVGLSFRQALEESDYLIRLSRYHQHLERFSRLYPRDRLKVLLYDDLSNEPLAFLRELFTYLEIDPDFVPESADRRYNRVMFQGSQDTLRRIGLGFAIEMVKATPVGDWIRKRHQRHGQGESQIPDRDIRYLREVFRDDVLALQEMTGHDLSAWLEV